MCGTNKNDWVVENCAIALAVRDIAPHAMVTLVNILWDGSFMYHNPNIPPFDREVSDLPIEAKKMIQLFDSTSPMKRLSLPEFSFEVDFPDVLVEKIGIEEVKAILEKSETLEAV